MFDAEGFVAECREAIADSQPSLAVKELLERTMSRDREVTAALGDPSKATLVVLHSSPELTVLNAVWAPCMTLYPHNHNMTAIIGIYGGQEDNTFWKRIQPGLVISGGRELQHRDVAVLGPNIIHSVSNPRRAYTAALHIYLGDFLKAERSEWDPDTLEEKPYSFEHAQRVFAEADAAWAQQQAAERLS